MIYLEKLEEAKKKKGRCWTGYKPKPGSVPYSKGSCVKEGYKLIGLALIEDKLEESSKKKVEKARKLERGARAGTTPKGRAYKAAYDAASSISRGRVKGVAKAVNSLIKQRNSELEEAKKRGYTFKEIDAYARGREKATIARRKKEFEDFYSKPKKKKKAELEEAKVDKGKPYGEKKRARSRRDLERAYQHASDTGEGKVGKMIRSKDFRKTAVLAARVNRKEGLPSSRPLKGLVKAEKKLKAESYIQIGDILAEAILGKIRTKAADKLDKFSRNQYRKGEVDDASGKPKRAGIRGRAAHAAGKLAQKVRPRDKS